MSTIKIPREKTQFVTPEGMLNFIVAYPGQAEKSFTEGSYAYKCEIAIDPQALAGPQGKSLIDACSLVASTYDTSPPVMDAYGNSTPGWHKRVFGPKGKLRKLEETDRDQTKCPYYAGKYILSLSTVYSAKSLGFKSSSFNLANPADREKFDQALNARAPGVKRYANPANPADVAQIQQINFERQAKGELPYPESEWRTVLLNVPPHEVWSGCFGRLAGRVYWNDNGTTKTLGLALDHILMTRTGERVGGGGGPSADEVFSAFAPSADLAPKPQVPTLPDFSNLM